MDQAVRITRRIEQIKKALARLGDMRPGSLSTQTRSWGGQYAQLRVGAKITSHERA